jgi:hypothetical protein
MHAFDRFSTGAAVLALVCGGCDRGASRGDDTAEAAGAATVLNGVNFNGLSFNGVSFNGVGLDPLSFAGVQLAGQTLASVSLDGSSLSATLPGGARATGSGLVGAELSGTLSNGDTVTVRIDGVTAGSEPDVQRYTVSARQAGSATFQPLCGAAADGTPVQAIPLAGSWDESTSTSTGGAHMNDTRVFTFACEGFALAKCVELGYAPWRSVTECSAPGNCALRSLASFHQACTRMLRADYCGDGMATTRDSTQVDVWDNFSIQTDDAPTWSLEAEWSPGGAVCVDQTRWPTIQGSGVAVKTYIQDRCPSAWQTPGCAGAGSTFFTANGFDVPLATRALLRTRVNARP